MMTISSAREGTSRDGAPVGEPVASAPAIGVLVALADPAARQRVVAALIAAPDLECAGEVESGAAAIAQVKVGSERPQLVLLDVAMPDIDAVAVVHRIAELRPDVHVVVLAGDADEERGILALRAGAVGYLSKDIGLEILLRVLRKVAEGEAAVPRTLTARLLKVLRDGPGAPQLPARIAPRVALGVFGLLAGVAGVAIAVGLPHSAADAAPGGAYVEPQFYMLLLLGSIEAILSGLLATTLALFRPGGRWLPTVLAVTAVTGLLVLAGMALAFVDYRTEPGDAALTRPAAPLRR